VQCQRIEEFSIFRTSLPAHLGRSCRAIGILAVIALPSTVRTYLRKFYEKRFDTVFMKVPHLGIDGVLVTVVVCFMS
jgi:hypothetical protein